MIIVGPADSKDAFGNGAIHKNSLTIPYKLFL